MNDFAALGFLFLLGVVVGAVLANTGQKFDFSMLATEQGIGFRASTNVRLPKSTVAS